YNKKMVGWEEILHPDMPKNIVIQSWRGIKSLVDAAEQGYQAILSSGYYIDLIQPTDYHYLNDPLPADIQLTEDQKMLILGGEAPMWAEVVSHETVDSRIWPRTAAIAERFWSPGSVKDVDDMYRRLEVVSFRLEELGLLHIKNTDMMLRRLTNNHNIKPLKTFIGTIEPVKLYKRNQLRPHTQQSPLTRVVDAAKPDADDARKFRKLVDVYLESSDSTTLLTIEEWLTKWQGNHARLVEIIKISPILREIESMSEDLAKISGLGLFAVVKIRGHEVPAGWSIDSEKQLDQAREPRGQAELMVVDAIEKLIKFSNQ
ncbi:family 20 glycosylhydrolase, partial [candidate division KSB1 bacterium]|nr:family 20 glycosylhydrolase [candidate division KSB1 bacterium]